MSEQELQPLEYWIWYDKDDDIYVPSLYGYSYRECLDKAREHYNSMVLTVEAVLKIGRPVLIKTTPTDKIQIQSILMPDSPERTNNYVGVVMEFEFINDEQAVEFHGLVCNGQFTKMREMIIEYWKENRILGEQDC